MSIDSRIYDAIENNSSITNKAWFNEKLQFAKSIYSVYDVDYNYDNILDIVKNIKIIEEDAQQNIHYDRKLNTLVIDKNSKNIEFELCKSFLEITSQSYDEKSNTYNSGITFTDEDGNELGKKINDILIDELITINTGLSLDDDQELTAINPLDTIVKDMLSITGTNNLITYFAFGQGKILFEHISSVIGYDNAKQFYKCIDNYEKNPALNKIVYDLCINALLNAKENNNTMSKM